MQSLPARLFGLTACVLAAHCMAAAPDLRAASDQENAAQVDALFQAFAGGKCPGVAVGIIRDGQLILKRGYGLADVEKAVPITSATIFRIGSVTKSFTSIAILQQVEAGKLSLDDPLARYLPDFPRSHEILIRHLLSHTAGVPDFVSIEQAEKIPLDFPPGTRINYSNTGYDLLGKVLEKVTGQKYEEVLRDQIFQPAGMLHSGYDTTAELPGRAQGYLLNEKGAYQPIQPEGIASAFAAGGLYSNVEDMARWEQALEAGKLLKQETLEMASTPYRLPDGRHTAYGMGFMTNKYRELREVGHGGDINGFNAYVARYPEHGFAVIVLSNTEMRPPGLVPEGGTIAHRIAEIYLGKFMGKPDEIVAVSVANTILDSYAGRYEVDAAAPITDAMGRYLVITRDGDHLMGVGKMGKMPLLPTSETTFRAPGSPAEITFVRDPQGKRPHLIISLMGLREFPAHPVD